MSEAFSGPWSVEVASLETAYAQRFMISGALTGDGLYPAATGFRVDVSGEAWILQLEWNDNAGSGWQLSDVRRSAEYTIREGLTVTLGADDNIDAVRDYDYNDVVLVCRSLDPEIDPPAKDPPLDFTISDDQFMRPDSRRVQGVVATPE
jgi:hypothetical protein